MRLSDALEVYFKENYSSTDFDALFIREVRKLEAIVEGSSELLENNTVGELLVDGLEEIAEDVSKTPSKYQGYVVRVSDYTSSVLGFVGYNDIDTIEDYKDRSVYGRFVEAKSDMDKFNAANKESLFSAHVILNGSRGYCDYAPECEEPSSHKESKTQEGFSPCKYVVRVAKPHEDRFRYVAKNVRLGASGSHKFRKVFDTFSEAWQVRSDYNNQAINCRAVVVPDGTEEYCRNAEPVEVNGEV